MIKVQTECHQLARPARGWENSIAAIPSDGALLTLQILPDSVSEDSSSRGIMRALALHWSVPCALVHLLPAYDLNQLGVKGLGEIGITGTAAAVANAVFHATGKRVRDLPISIGRLR